MPEPNSSVAAAGYFLLKIAVPTALATAVVAALTAPKSPREWALTLITTVVASIFGGGFLIRYFGIHAWASESDAFYSLGGVYFVCGLPGWFLIRTAFLYFNKNKDRDIFEVIKDTKAALKETA